MASTVLRCTLVTALLFAALCQGAPIQPRSDAEVIETLPSAKGERAELRKLRRELQSRPGDSALAATLAQRYLDQARELGDPRYAGLALAALQPWQGARNAPAQVLLLQATLEQHLHRFDAAALSLERLLEREPALPQAWLTLATIRRVQGRYAASDRSCGALNALRATVHAAACQAENDALRGNVDAARQALRRLLAAPGLDAGLRNWLATTQAELEERAGNVGAAEAAWAAALQAQAAPYTVLGYADFLIFNARHTRALELLAQAPRNDAVVLRQAIASTRSGAPGTHAAVREMRERIAAANQRPDTPTVHGREQAMFALWVDQEPRRAFELAQGNVRLQREPIDLLILAQAARALGDPDALREASRVKREVGLFDTRIDALL